jgi:ElaB/YqjD/DUF883 family membrane-anchored ribosome-binding protein
MSGSWEKFSDGLRTLIALAEELRRANGAGLTEEAANAHAAASPHDARERFATAQHAMVTRTRDAELYVRTNPWRSIALAGGAGVLVGLLMGRR